MQQLSNAPLSGRISPAKSRVTQIEVPQGLRFGAFELLDQRHVLF
jgi:hypothetical protein